MPRLVYALLRVVAVVGIVVACGMGAVGGIAIPLSAQEQPSIGSLLDDADRLKAAKRFDEARVLYDAAVARARQDATDDIVARALLGRADLFLWIRQWDPGIQDAREALEISLRLDLKANVAQARLLAGAFEAGKGNHAPAIALLQQAIDDYVAIADYTRAARAAIRLSGIFSADDDAENEIAALTNAAEHARAAKQTGLEADALHNLGDAFFNVDRYEESMAALQAAAKGYESLGLLGELGTVHNSMGRVFRAHGRMDEALREQQLALDLHRRGTDKVLLLQSLNAVAVTYQRLGYYDKARAYLDQARALVADVAERVPYARDFLDANLAGLLMDSGQYDIAAQILESVLARGQDRFPGIRWGDLSSSYLELGRAEDARKAAVQAVAKCGTSKDICARMHSALAQALVALNRRAEARDEGLLALNMVENLRKQLLPEDAFRREFANNFKAVYTQMIGLNVGEGDAKAGLEAAEQARARAFIDLLGSRSLEPASSAAAPSIALRGSLVQSASAATSDDLTATANRLGSAIVAYWVGDHETFIWVTDHAGRVFSKRVQVSRSTLARLVRETQPFEVDASKRKPFPLTTRGASPMALVPGDAAWRQLHQFLIVPIRSFLPTNPGALLTIIPHDVLNGVSFAALKDVNGRYLLEDFTLHYAPAGALFQFTSTRRRADARTGTMLLISDPTLPRRSPLDEPLSPLPGTRAESAKIAKYARSGATTILQGSTASEQRIRELSADRSVLHFATHAIVREDDPLASELVLASSGGDSTQDGSLTADEIYGMRLRADLVVLSACRSGAGAVPGEAMATFARAFLYAGTASVIASIWDVADEPTSQLVSSFYKEWFGGADKAAALRRAQLKLLDDLREGRVRVSTSLGTVPLPEHPVFWAGFVLFGEPR